MRKRKLLSSLVALSMAAGTTLSALPVLPTAAQETLPDPAIIPLPLEASYSDSVYELTEDTRIVVMAEDEASLQSLHTTADLLAARFRRSTGYALPVVEDGAENGDIVLTLGGNETLEEEGYTLSADETGVVISAYEPAGVYNGTQTLRQMFPSDIEKLEVVEDGDWRIKGAQITDKPEYGYRGMHLDVSRHFFTVEEVERQIDLISQFKMNKLHLHLSDDQGWRLEIKGEMYGESLDKLRTIGASTSCDYNGVKAGMYTQEDFKEMVAYAAARNVEIIPEFDMPAHAWAALVSLNFLNSTEDGKPYAAGYDNTMPYQGWDVGWASLETDNEKTYEFVEEVVKQVAAISPSEYIHLGGDEAHSTSSADYAYFMNRINEIGKKYGKKVIGWQNFDTAMTDTENGIAQFWSTGNAKMKSGVNYIATPADHAYMDMKYDSDSEFGLTWATYNPVDDSYNWDPTDYGTKDQIIGVECALWTETISSNYGLDYMIYPRVAGHAEVGWTPKSMRSWDEYKTRIAQYDTRLVNEGVELRRDEIIWPEPYIPVNATFSFNEGEGNVVSDQSGEYTAVISGNPEWVEGVKGSALHFDGETCIDLNHKDLEGSWTVSVWVNPDENNATNTVILSGSEGEIKLSQWEKTGKVGITKFGVKDYVSGYTAPVGQWTHLTFVCDETKTDIYVNGVKEETISAAIKGPFGRIGHCYKSGLSDVGFIYGSMDELKVFNTVLSEEEVLANYQADSGISKAELNTLIEKAETYVESDWTPASWAVLAAALANAKTVAEDENADASALSDAWDALNQAIKGLEPLVAEGSIRIASYNIAAGKKPNLEAISAQMKASGITIAGLQEIDINTGRNNYDMMERLASYGAYPYTTFQKTIDYSGGQYGIGIASSLPISSVEGAMLYSENIDEPRAWNKVVIEKDGHELALYNTHLTHEDQEIRKAQLEELLEIVLNDPTEYKAVTGDFNTDQELSEWLPAMKVLNLSNGHDGNWFTTYGEYDSTMKNYAIDNILVTRNLKINDVFVVDSALSDHYMLVGEFEFLDEEEVSKDYLNWLINEAAGLEEDLYSQSSWQALQDALALAETLGADATQSEVDAVAQALETALSQLVAEKTWINDSVTGTGLNQFNFVGGWKTSVNYPDLFYGGDEHWVNFTSWTGTELPYYTIQFQGTGIELYGALNSMMGIYEVTVDDEEPVEADAYAPSRQTQQCFYARKDLPYGLHTVKVSATTKKNDLSTSTDIEVDFAIVYNESVKSPVEDTDGIKALLKAAMLYAETIMDSEDYAKLAPAVRNLIETTYANAARVYTDETATFDEVADAWKQLADAIHYASFFADKSALKEKIDEYSALDLSGYTPESKEALETALEKALEVFNDANALQERIDQALKDLLDAYANLEVAPKPEVDKTLLKLLIDQSDLALAKQDAYVQDETWNAFVTALDEAKTVYENAMATQDEVTQAVTALHQAYLSIRLLPDEELVAQLQAFITLANQIHREFYSAQELDQIDQAATLAQQLLNAEVFDSAKAQRHAETLNALSDLIAKREAQPSVNKAVQSTTVHTATSTRAAGLFAAAGLAALALMKSRKSKK